MDQPGVGRAKPARIEVEGCEVGLEVDVEPFASCGLGVLRGETDGPRSNALALVSAVRLRVDEKGMVSAVGYDVDEADEAPTGVAGSHPAQTVCTDSIPPADLGASAMGIDELNHLRVGQRAAPAVGDAVGNELGSDSRRCQTRSEYPAPSLHLREIRERSFAGGWTFSGRRVEPSRWPRPLRRRRRA